MPATVTDLKTWKASHPPLVRLWVAQGRAVAAWWSLFFSAFRR